MWRRCSGSLTPILFSNASLGVIGMLPPALPNILSSDFWTLSENKVQTTVKQTLPANWTCPSRKTESLTALKQLLACSYASWTSNLTQKMVIGVSLIFEGKSTVTDMIQVLQPLKVRDSYTACIDVKILRKSMKCSLSVKCIWRDSKIFTKLITNNLFNQWRPRQNRRVRATDAAK